MNYQNVFDEQNEFSSYLLGFWLADGNISFKPRIGTKPVKGFSLYNTDRQIMDDIGKRLNRSVSRMKRSNAKETWLPPYQINIWSEKIYDFCHTITKSTSKSNKPVDLPTIHPELIRHFIRGFFDGDGSVHIKLCKNRHGKFTSVLGTSFTAGLKTEDFLDRLQDLIRTQLPELSRKKQTVWKTSRKLIYGQYDSMLLCDWMYGGNASIYMKRKKAVYDSFPRERLLASLNYLSPEKKQARLQESNLL